jgi:hypothetical protein
MGSASRQEFFPSVKTDVEGNEAAVLRGAQGLPYCSARRSEPASLEARHRHRRPALDASSGDE